MLEKQIFAERKRIRGTRICALISIVFIMGMSFSPLTGILIEDTAGELPSIHDSSAPEETGWVLVGYDRYIEDDPVAMGYAYLALFCREVGTDRFQFKFTWQDSPHISFMYEGEEAHVEDHYFMGVVYRDNGCDQDPDLIWDTGIIGNSNAGEYETQASETIDIRDWTGVRFGGYLMAHTTIEPSFWDRVNGYVLKIEVGIMNGVAWSINPILGILATVAGVLILDWHEEECLQDEDLNLFYHQIYGGLDLLNDAEACVQIELTSANGYDLPDVLEGAPGERKYVDQFDISVKCAFPSKLSIDVYMMFEDLVSEEFEDQALSQIDRGRTMGAPRITILDFPVSKVRTPLDQGKMRSLEIEWDISENYFDVNAFHDEDIRNYLDSGSFVSLDEQFKYLGQVGCIDWNIPTIQFEIKVEIDYELPAEILEDYPANPLYTIYQEQRLCSSLDYYTLGHTSESNRIEREDHDDFTVFLGDESIPQTISAPLTPIYIGWQMLEGGGINIDMPDELYDLVVLPPESHQLIGEITSEDDPDRRFAIADPIGWKDVSESVFDGTFMKHSPIRSITVRDPEKTIFFIPEPGIIPGSLTIDPPPFTVDGRVGDTFEENAMNWIDLWNGTQEELAGEPLSEIERRSQFALRVDQGDVGPDLLPVHIMDPDCAYLIGIELPDGDTLDLITINQPSENELGSVTVRDRRSFLMIPGSAEFVDGNEGFISTTPNEDDGVMIDLRPMNRTGDTAWLNTLPLPEEHTIFSIEDRTFMERMPCEPDGSEPSSGENVVTISLVEDGINSPARELGILSHANGDPLNDPFHIGNFIHVDQDVIGITTYTPEFGFDQLPRSYCYLDNDPNSLLMDLDPSCESGFFVTSDPNTPSYSALDLTDPESVILVISLSSDSWTDDEIGGIVSERTTAEDGVLVRGVTTFPSEAPDWEIGSWVVASEYSHRDTLRSHPDQGDLIYSKHMLERGIEPGNYQYLLHHPGEDGEFFSLGPEDEDGQYLQANGAEMFISIARGSSDDLFLLRNVMIEETEISIETIEEAGEVLVVEGYCNRLDGTFLTLILEDEDGNSRENSTYTMFGKYSLRMDIGDLTGGTYTLIVSDPDGNSTERTADIQNGGME